MVKKKRELLSLLHNCILELSNMSSDIAKLEITDNSEASKRMKVSLLNFREGSLKQLEGAIKSVRQEIIIRPRRAYNGDNSKFLKQYRQNQQQQKNKNT